MDIIKRKYTLEFPPIHQHRERDGSWIRNLVERNMRVVDAYTGAPVGIVAYRSFDKKYEGQLNFGRGNYVEEPSDGWGDRFDLAAEAVWQSYSNSLPWHARVERWAWRWMEVGWFVFGTVGGGVAGAFATLALKGSGAG